jgi:excisionase family DNA binding protein
MPATDSPEHGMPAMQRDRIAYTLKDAARLLSLSYRKVRDMADKGELEVFKIGRVRRVHASVLDAYIARQQQEHQRAS